MSGRKARVPADRAEWLSVQQAAELLGLSQNAVYMAIDRGDMPGVLRIGRNIRIKKSALDAAAGG